jgi:acetyl-CoA synthetase
MLSKGPDYETTRAAFRWQIPEYFNIGVDVCDKWAEREPGRLALAYVEESGGGRDLSFGELRELSNRMANLLLEQGARRGDRIAILLPQRPETAIAHIAIHKIGAISLPMFVLFGPEALRHRLADSGASLVVTDSQGAEKLRGLRDALPGLRCVISTGGGADALDLDDALARQSTSFEPVRTKADDPAILIYTSGTTGMPKGALHGHRVLLGHLPGVEMSHDFLPQEGDRIWTPADWAWIGGLLDVLLPALHHGVPVVARRFAKFSGEAAFELMQEQAVRNAFLPPTALKLMRSVPDAERRWRLDLRSVASGGETLGSELIEWGQRVLGATINEFYGQTECNMIVSSCADIMPPCPGAMGRPVPGHEVAVIDAGGRRCDDGELGMIAVHRPDPAMFLGYWNNERATAEKFVGDWLVTGDLGMREAGGWLRFVGRDDDVITSSGYRIGPGEIEDCLLQHPAVSLAAAVGAPDPERTEIVKAFIVLNDGFAASDALRQEISRFVRERLAAHEYPREIEFTDTLPMTTTGKIIRRELRNRAAGPTGRPATG